MSKKQHPCSMQTHSSVLCMCVGGGSFGVVWISLLVSRCVETKTVSLTWKFHKAWKRRRPEEEVSWRWRQPQSASGDCLAGDTVTFIVSLLKYSSSLWSWIWWMFQLMYCFGNITQLLSVWGLQRISEALGRIVCACALWWWLQPLALLLGRDPFSRENLSRGFWSSLFVGQFFFFHRWAALHMISDWAVIQWILKWRPTLCLLTIGNRKINLAFCHQQLSSSISTWLLSCHWFA